MANEYSTTLTATFEVDFAWQFVNTLDLSTTSDKSRDRLKQALTNGTSANNVDEMWFDQRTVTVSTPTDQLALYNTQENVFGRTVNFEKVKLILIRNLGKSDGSGSFTETAGEDLRIFGGGLDNDAFYAPFTGSTDIYGVNITVGTGDIFCLTNFHSGFTVDHASGNDMIQIVNNGTDDITYNIVIAGTTA